MGVKDSHGDACNGLYEVHQEEEPCRNSDCCITPDGEAASVIIRELIIIDFVLGDVEDAVGAVQFVMDFVMLFREYPQGYEGDNHREKEYEREENVAHSRTGIATAHSPTLSRLFRLHRFRYPNKRAPPNSVNNTL